MRELQNQLVHAEIEDGLATVTINHPPVNALNAQVIAELDQVIGYLAGRQEVRAVVITGAGEKAFVAGADITQFPKLTPEKGRELALTGQAVFSRLEGLDAVVIAAINGFALGGGCELALACDIRLAAANARLGQPEVNLGIIPGYGGTQRLPRLVGMGKAMQLILVAEQITAEEARRIGLVDEVVPPGEVLQAAKSMAKVILSKGPRAVRLAKKAIRQGLSMPLQQGLELETHFFSDLCSTADQKEGSAAFLEKRPPVFQDK